MSNPKISSNVIIAKVFQHIRHMYNLQNTLETEK